MAQLLRPPGPGGPCVHVEPSHAQVSSRAPILVCAARPPKMTVTWRALSYAPHAARRAGGEPPGVRAVHVEPSHSQRSLFATPLATPPKATTRDRAASNVRTFARRGGGERAGMRLTNPP